jgi:hypothetical protein
VTVTTEPKSREWKAMLGKCRGAMTRTLTDQAVRLFGVSNHSLSQLELGFDDSTGCYSFPMRDGRRRLTGFRLLPPDDVNRKLYADGSAPGLFIPRDYEPLPYPYELSFDDKCFVLCMPKSPVDTALVLDLGFGAIGRIGERTCADQIVTLLNASPQQELAIFSERMRSSYVDDDGAIKWRNAPVNECALALAERILPACGKLHLIQPPDKSKDLREFLQTGDVKTRRHLLRDAILNPSSCVNRDWLGARRKELAEWKQKLMEKNRNGA